VFAFYRSGYLKNLASSMILLNILNCSCSNHMVSDTHVHIYTYMAVSCR